MRRILLLIFLSLLVSLPAFGEAGMWGQRGISRRFVVQGDRLYAADGRGVAVYDVHDPAHLARIDVESGENETNDLALMGAGDLIVATSAGLERFSVGDDGTLQRLGSIEATGPASRVAANARYAAASSGKTLTLVERNSLGGLRIVNSIVFRNAVTALAFVGDYLYAAVDRQPLSVFAPPETAPVKLLSGVNAEALAVSDGVLWAASPSDGLTAIDVSSPGDPTVLGNAGRNDLQLRGVAAAGPHVFAYESPDRLHVFDGTTPREPRLVTTVTEWVNVLAASGAWVFFAGPVVEASGLAFDPGLIPRETGRPLRALDATNLAAPIVAGEYRDYAGPVTGVWTDGSVAYVVDPPFLRVLDVSTTSQPREAMALEIPNLQDRIRVKNHLAVIYGRAYVNLVDVSVPLRPRLLSTWDAQGHPPSSAAILRTNFMECNEHSGLHVVDTSDRSRPVQVGGRKWHYIDIATGDDVAYALLRGNMLVAEIAEERTVVDREEIPAQHVQIDVAPPGSALPDFLLARGEDGLHLYSLEDRFHPERSGFLPVTGLGVFATGERSAYVARNGRLHFVDLDQELELQPTEMRVTSPMQISVAGEKIVVADRYSVRVYGPNTAPPPPASTRRRPTRH